MEKKLFNGLYAELFGTYSIDTTSIKTLLLGNNEIIKIPFHFNIHVLTKYLWAHYKSPLIEISLTISSAPEYLHFAITQINEKIFFKDFPLFLMQKIYRLIQDNLSTYFWCIRQNSDIYVCRKSYFLLLLVIRIFIL